MRNPSSRQERLLLHISGQDRPGILSEVLQALDQQELQLLDVQQITTLGQLGLSILVAVTPEHGLSVVRHLGRLLHQRGFNIDFLVLDPEDIPVAHTPLHLTYLAPQVKAKALSALVKEIAAMHLNVERINWVSRQPLQCIEMTLTQNPSQSLRFEEIRPRLFAVALAHQFDLGIQEENLSRRAKRLVVMDMDSTLIQQEVIDEIAAEAGLKDQVAALTEKAMRGELDFEAALHERVALLKDLPVSALESVKARICLTPGVEHLVSTLKHLGYKLAVVSGGFTYFTDAIRKQLDLDYSFANTLEIQDGKLTGRLTGDIVDRAAKARILRTIAQAQGIPLEQTVAVGDGANDLDMLQAAGLGIAFNAKPAVQEQAGAFLSQPGLDTVLYLLGIRDFSE